MSAAVTMAGLAGVLLVLAGWEALAAGAGVRVPRALRAALTPLRRAEREGRAPSSAERRRLGLLGAAVLLLGGWLIAGPLAGVLAALAGPWAALGLVRLRRRRYRAALERSAPAVARALGDALGAGHSIRGSIGEAAHGLTGAAGAELQRAAAALQLGERTEAVLESLRTRASNPAYDTMVAAMLLQRDAGGDLAQLLRQIATAQEAAQRLEQDARSATAQARFTALLVAALPLGAAVLAELGRPGFLLDLASKPLSAWLLGCSAVLQAFAWVAILRIARVR
jgi:tight adherence protein B